jgi:hypothetical protein
MTNRKPPTLILVLLIIVVGIAAGVLNPRWHHETPTAMAASPQGALAVGNTASNGNIGGLTAAQSVDAYSSFVLTQNTAAVVATLPTPTNASAGRQAVVSLSGASSNQITMYGNVLSAGSTILFQWDGTIWSPPPPSTVSNPRFSLANLANGLGATGLTIATSVVNLAGGPDFYTTTPGVNCTGMTIQWWNNSGGTRTLKANLFRVSDNARLASCTTTVSADGLVSCSWAAVPLTVGVQYWATMGLNDGGNVWSHYTVPSGIAFLSAQMPTNNVIITVVGNYTSSDSSPPTSNIGADWLPTWPILSGN